VRAFYLDENVTERLADALADLGFDAISANRRHKGLNDAAQLLTAASLGRILVTTNTSDYLLLHRAWTSWSTAWGLDPVPKHAGILLMHTAPGYNYRRMADEIAGLMRDDNATEIFSNRAFAWNANTRWHEV
jgi:hypothetical protein